MNNEHDTSGLSILKSILCGRHWWIPLAMAEAVVLGLAIALIFWAHPLNDDFKRAVNLRQFGFPECIIKDYFGWTGRWSARGLGYALNSLFDLTHVYQACLLISFLLYVLAGYFFITSVLQTGRQRLLSWALTLSLFSLYWAGMSHPGETVYWLTGMCENHLSIALWMVIIGCSIRLRGPLTKGSGLYALGLAALSFVTMGMHELFGAMALVVLIVAAVIAMYIGHPQRHVWVIVAAAALVGFLVVFMAPGNEARMAWNASHGFRVQDLRLSIFLAGYTFLRLLGPWIVDPKLLAATALFVAVLPISRLKPTWLETTGVPWRLTIPAVSLILLAMGFFGPAWAGGNCGTPRTHNGIYMVFLLGWFLTVFVCSRCNREVGTNQPRNRLWLVACGMILAAGLLQADNTRKAILDIRWRVQDYDHIMQQRHELMRESFASGKMIVKVPPITAWPESYLHAPMSSDSGNHWNRVVARYFGLEEVVCAPLDDP